MEVSGHLHVSAALPPDKYPPPVSFVNINLVEPADVVGSWDKKKI